MKTLYSIVFLLTLSFGYAQFTNKPDDIIGDWQTGSGKGRVRIEKNGSKYNGKLFWLREPLDENGVAKKDFMNPDPALRNRSKIGIQVLLGFNWDEDSYENGTIYDPENGKTYSCTIEMVNANTLNVRGYIGISLIGRTDVWKRVVYKKMD
jgi:uncharacterized protein (DUF2147 family)